MDYIFQDPYIMFQLLIMLLSDSCIYFLLWLVVEDTANGDKKLPVDLQNLNSKGGQFPLYPHEYW